MSFRITDIRLQDFRNYQSYTCSDFGDLNILVGHNAVGKTNLLEAIQLTTALTSFRHPQIGELIGWDKESASVCVSFVDGKRVGETKLILDGEKRQYLHNGKKIKRLDLAGVVPAVLFSPDDLNLVKGGSAGKRHAIDSIGEQVSRNYRVVRRDYEKIIRQKNNLLKDHVSKLYMDSVNDTVLRVGGQLFMYRQMIVEGLQEHFAELYADIVGKNEKAGFSYVPSWCDCIQGADVHLSREEVLEAFSGALEAKSDEERERGRSLVGPHLDTPMFLLEGRDAQTFASQGQQRSLALGFKLAELKYIQEKTDSQPILLLDDVMSELDEVRRSSLMRYISKETQTFITTTNLDYFTENELAEARVIRLEDRK